MRQVKILLKNHGLLIFLVSLVYLPFLGDRVVRTAGDEKVYIAQALEMMKNGTGFLQTLGGVPDYYKGPAHYVLLQLGFKVFGYSLWAAVYMNFLFCLLGALAVAETVRRAYPKKHYWSCWAGAFFAFNVGISGHLFASQMEVEIAGLYGLGFFLLWRSKNWKGDLLFWLVAGASGWFKSPLHSVLIGLSAILFWLSTGELWPRIKNYRSFLTATAGIALCAGGYAPAFFLDQNNFWKLYILKETISSKGSNGGPWWQAGLPMLSYYLIPWMALAFIAYFETLGNFLFKKKPSHPKGASEKSRFLKLALCGMTPTLFFFTYYPYRGENYALPIVGAVAYLIFYLLEKTEGAFPRFRSILLWLGALFVFPVVAFFTAIYARFTIADAWWPSWVLPLTWGFAFLSLLALLWDRKKRENGLGFGVSLSKASIVLILNFILMVFGEMEVYQLKARIRTDREAGMNYRVTYWNLNRFIWNESGLISLSIREPITPLYHSSELLDAIRQGDLILGRDTDVGKEIIEIAKKNFPHLEPLTFTWDRWKTHASDGAGNSLIPKAWREKDLSVLFDHALILRFQPRQTL